MSGLRSQSAFMILMTLMTLTACSRSRHIYKLETWSLALILPFPIYMSVSPLTSFRLLRYCSDHPLTQHTLKALEPCDFGPHLQHPQQATSQAQQPDRDNRALVSQQGYPSSDSVMADMSLQIVCTGLEPSSPTGERVANPSDECAQIIDAEFRVESYMG